jgi:hypothetical protein
MEVSNFYKKWVAFLKQRKVYGKYILCIQSANKNIITKQHGMWETTYVSTIEPFFSKNDYFSERLKIQNICDLSYHISLLSFKFCGNEYIFLNKIFSDFSKLIEEERKKRLPIPRKFKIKKNSGRAKGEQEENSPWYNQFYQNKKNQWRK